VGQPVFALGAPEGFEFTFSSGNISAIRDNGDSYNIQMTAPISQGSSGGGLYDQQARLIGITTAVIKDAQNINFAIPVETVTDALKSSDNGSRIHTKLSNKIIPIDVPDGFKPFGLLDYGIARTIDITLPPDYILLDILVAEEGFGALANGESGEHDLPIILIAAPDDPLLQEEDFSKTRDRIRRQFNSLSEESSTHPFMNDLEKIAAKVESLFGQKTTMAMDHQPQSIFIDTAEQIGISDISFPTMHIEGEDPFDETDGTRDTYLITKDGDSWVGVFLYDSGETYSFEDAQEIVKGVFVP